MSTAPAPAAGADVENGAATARMTLTVGVDIGGTKVAAGVVDEAGRILASTRRDTPSDDSAQVEAVIADAVRELTASYEVAAVGLGAAGFVDGLRSMVLFAPNLAWRETPLRAAIEQRLGLPAVVENDANAAAWAEARFGAGRGEDHLVMITLGTGIGRWLGEGIADLAVVLDPAVVVVGGGVGEAGDLLLEPAREAYAAALSAGSHRPHLEIMPAVLGNDAGLIGAADLARVP